MNSSRSRLAGAALGALFVAGLTGAGVAFAQTTEDSPPSTTGPPATAPAAPGDDRDCPEKGLRGGSRGGHGGPVDPTPAPSSGTDPGAL
jgi:hypothetical protein